MAKSDIDPNGLLKFKFILEWIAKRNLYSIHSENTEIGINCAKLEIELRNEPVSLKVTVLADQHKEYYERTLRTVADICELNFNEDNDFLLSKMLKGAKDFYLNLEKDGDGIEILLGKNFGFSE